MRRLLVGLLVVAGCHKASSVASPKDADALWALAPEGTMFGIVVTPRALTMVEHGWQDVHAFLTKAPDLAPVAKMLDEQLTELTGAPDLRLADYGLTAEKGGALFITGVKEGVMIVPLADRDKFLAKRHGTKGSGTDQLEHGICKEVRGVYACATSEALFDKLGKSKLRDKLGVRGDIEIVADGIPHMPIKSAIGVVQLERGAVVLRGSVAGLPAAELAKLGAPVKPSFDRDHSAGFSVASVGALLSQMPDEPMVPGLSTSQLAHSLAGPVYLSLPAGQAAFEVRVPLTDTAPAQTLLSHCTDLPGAMGATYTDGTCHTPVPQMNTSIDAWLDGKTLRIGMKNLPPAKSVPLTAIGAELAETSWNFAFWGRGSMLAAPAAGLPFPPDSLSNPQFGAIIRGMMMLDEFGFATRIDGDKVHFVATVRTAWSNPDDVVAKLASANPIDVISGKGSALVAGIPSSAPLAHDIDAGYMGVMLPIAFVGILSAVAIPAFTDYMNKSKQTEASLVLHSLQRKLEIYWETDNKFPVGDVPLPAEPCCKGPHGKCARDATIATTGPWHELEFSMDEPHLFQYSYHSDGKTAEVDAVGDLDCDGIAITYRLKMDGTSGTPEARMEEPPPNTD